MALHDNTEIHGISEDCKYNDHATCRGIGCGCDCHIESRRARDMAAVRVEFASRGDRAAAKGVTGSAAAAAGVEKICPKCKTRRPEEEMYCREDGSELSSLLCKSCMNLLQPEDKYCAYCGFKQGQHDHDQQPASPEPASPAVSSVSRISGVVRIAGLPGIDPRMFK